MNGTQKKSIRVWEIISEVQEIFFRGRKMKTLAPERQAAVRQFPQKVHEPKAGRPQFQIGIRPKFTEPLPSRLRRAHAHKLPFPK